MSSQQHILIAGLGVSGMAAARLALALKAQVTVLDGGDNSTLRDRAGRLEALGCRVILGFNGDAQVHRDVPAADLAVLSPGIPPESALVKFCRDRAREVLGEFEFGARHLECPILAITGTNGKTTTTELTTHCLKTAGLDAVAAGNIGTPMSEVACEFKPDVVVAEISSFQIETLVDFRPKAVAVLNLSPDHLDRYPDFVTYARAKLRIIDFLPSFSSLVLRADLAGNPLLLERWPEAATGACLFSATAQVGCRFQMTDDRVLVKNSPKKSAPEPIVRAHELQIQGAHNIENALAAAALCDTLGIPMQTVANGLKSFRPSDHRLQYLGTWAGIRVINDSKSTNPDSLVRALESVGDPVKQNVILIAGGLGKNLEFTAARDAIGRFVRRVFCLGESAERLIECWGAVADCVPVNSLEKAVEQAVESAVNGDTVLLSPGCASQDMFTDYAERGRKFIELISRRLNNVQT